MNLSFRETVCATDPDYLNMMELETLQINLGNRCNQSCLHCHIDAGPGGRRLMGKSVIDEILDILRDHPNLTLDITGGAPEMNPHFRYLVTHAQPDSRRVTVRTNLTILLEKGMEWVAAFYRDQDVTLISSLPCYLEENVDRQRGATVYARSIAVLKRLNGYGYGYDRELDLVYNTQGPQIAPEQTDLETRYREFLEKNHGVVFSRLFTITNSPLGRFRRELEERNQFESYLELLESSFNSRAAGQIMCRSLISVDCQGMLYNCDFNQAASLPLIDTQGRPLRISGLTAALDSGISIRTDDHCYSCTAGQGSSCTGALSL